VSRNSRRRTVALAFAGTLVLVTPAISACGAGTHPQTLLPTQFVEGVNVSVGLVDVRNMFLLGPAPGQTLPVGGDVPLYGAIVNDDTTTDQLVAIEAGGIAKSAAENVPLPPHQLVQLGKQGPGATTPTVVLKGLTQPLNGTETAHLILHFARAGQLSVQVPVVPWQGYYQTYAPAPTATPSLSASPGVSASVSPGDKRKPRHGATQSPSPTPSP
jgi:hypothetical protein